MKKLFAIATVAIIMVSCKSKSANETNVLSASDSTSYKEFVKWKEDKAAEKAKPVVTHHIHSTSNNTTANNTTANSTATTQPAEKKGWSKSAKGAVIGAGAGAAAGAIINKNDRVKGAVIGGVLGAGAGYGIGKVIEKKDQKH